MSTILELHILQTFPVSCLNRDDVGAVKTVEIGGVTRARVSSQCWKRQIRMALRDLGVKIGMRTFRLAELIKARLAETDGEIAEPARNECAEKAAAALGAEKTGVFMSASDIDQLCSLIRSAAFDPDRVTKKDIEKLATSVNRRNGSHDGLDIALFGRMLAAVDNYDVEAAVSVSHAYTTHAVTTGLDYFTTLDDATNRAGMIGTTDFSAGTFYRYLSLNVDQLKRELGIKKPEDLTAAVTAFLKAVYIAVPQARQHTMAAYSPWSYAKVLVRTGQPFQCCFEKPVRAVGFGGMLEPSVKAMESEIAHVEKISGSLYGKKAEFAFGTGDKSIDDLCAEVCQALNAQ